MYINNIIINAKKAKNAVLLAVGIAGMIIFGATGVYVLLDEKEGDMALFFFLVAAISIFLIYRSVTSRKLIDSTTFYSRYFEGDIDGKVNTSDMVKVIGKDEKTINKELKSLLRRRYMTNFILRAKDGKMQVVLASKIEKCECKNCAGVFEKKIYFTGVCPYCGGSDLFAKIKE